MTAGEHDPLEAFGALLDVDDWRVFADDQHATTWPTTALAGDGTVMHLVAVEIPAVRATDGSPADPVKLLLEPANALVLARVLVAAAIDAGRAEHLYRFHRPEGPNHMTTRILTEDHSSPANAIDVRFDDEGPGLYLELELRRGDISNALQAERAPLEAEARKLRGDRDAMADVMLEALVAGQEWRRIAELALGAMHAHRLSLSARKRMASALTVRDRRLYARLADADVMAEAHVADHPRLYLGDSARWASLDELGLHSGPENTAGAMVRGGGWDERIGEEAQRTLSAREARALAAALVHHADELDRARR